MNLQIVYKIKICYLKQIYYIKTATIILIVQTYTIKLKYL